MILKRLLICVVGIQAMSASHVAAMQNESPGTQTEQTENQNNVMHDAAFFKIEQKCEINNQIVTIRTIQYHGYQSWDEVGISDGSRYCSVPYKSCVTIKDHEINQEPGKASFFDITFLDNDRWMLKYCIAPKSCTSAEDAIAYAKACLDPATRPLAVRAVRIYDQIKFYDAQENMIIFAPYSRESQADSKDDLKDFEAYVNMDGLINVEDQNTCVVQ